MNKAIKEIKNGIRFKSLLERLRKRILAIKAMINRSGNQ
jgi:hypothetical protein